MDLEFVYGRRSRLYCTVNGCTSIDPALFFRMQIIGLLQGKNLIVSLAKKSIRTWHTAPSASLISAIKFLITHRKPEFASVLVDFPGFARHQKAL